MNTMLKEQLATDSIYLPTQGRIVDIYPLSAQEKLLKVALPDGISLAHRPGQFVQVSLPGIGEAPISIASSPSRSNGSFDLCIRRAGDLTSAIHRLEPGDTLGIRGPFGNGIPLERFRGRDILFAPGGLGLAPLRSSVNQVLDNRSNYGRVIILYGARNPGELLFKSELDEWAVRPDVELHVTVDRPDQDWRGNIGVITTLFKDIQIYAPNTIAITCGPPVMYRFVIIELLSLGIREGNIWLSLERRMKCGVGKCGHCQINQLYTCKDGPCFTYAQIKSLEEAF